MNNYSSNLESNNHAEIVCKKITSAAKDIFRRPKDELHEDQISFSDYKSALSDIKSILKFFKMGDSLISEQIKAEILNQIRQTSKLPLQFIPNARCCLVAFPCRSDGKPWDDQQIQSAEFLHFLCIDNNDNTIIGYAPSFSQVFRILPTELQQNLTIQLPDLEHDNFYNLDSENYQMLLKSINQIIDKAQDFYSQI